ncbi:MAG: hypothetical protein JXQ25_06845 [Deltaproteobacteria bacterium]|nr:hypothetical protein [Deltaproteobacteria bacterium]
MKETKKFISYLYEQKGKYETELEILLADTHFPEFEKPGEYGLRLHLGIIYRLLGDIGKSNSVFKQVVTIRDCNKEKYPIEHESRKNGVGQSLYNQLASLDIENAIVVKFTDSINNRADFYFKDASQLCRLDQSYISDARKARNYDDLAIAALWRGYALLCLGDYSGAYVLLRQVVPYFNEYKKSAGEVWQRVEYALPLALVPLCEFKIRPTKEHLIAAREGLERYIKSLHDYRDRLDGYLYYLHLKEAFPEVYQADPSSWTEPAGTGDADEFPRIPPLKMSSEADDETGAVMVFDREKSGTLEVFGSNRDLERFVGYVSGLPGFPVLSNLFEIYAVEAEQEPGPLVSECNRLLGMNNVDEWAKQKARVILEVANDAKAEGGSVMLYFEPEIDPETGRCIGD